VKEQKPLPEPARRGFSGVAIALIGCGTLLLLGCAGVCGLGLYGYLWGVGKLDAFAEEFEARGYQRVTGQIINVTTPLRSPQVYTCQMLTVRSQVDADLAIMCQVAEIHGTVNGDIVFLGQLLVIKEGAVVNGSIEVRNAQAVEVHGSVQGEISGNYAVLNWPARDEETKGEIERDKRSETIGDTPAADRK
jgi:hypothetical protein